jgi:pilus assembly protein Flp/PilA
VPDKPRNAAKQVDRPRLAGGTTQGAPVYKTYATLLTLAAFAKDRLRKEDGATAVEYGLLVGLIAVAIVGTLIFLGPRLNNLFQTVLNALP